MTTRLLLVRHGATRLNAEDRFSGATGVELSEEGRAQAERLAERLAHETIGAIYSSPLSRAADTAAILAEPHGLAVQTRDGLRESLERSVTSARSGDRQRLELPECRRNPWQR